MYSLLFLLPIKHRYHISSYVFGCVSVFLFPIRVFRVCVRAESGLQNVFNYGVSSESDDVVSDAHSLELIECVDKNLGALLLVVAINDDGLR